jgi:hypothetical protein
MIYIYNRHCWTQTQNVDSGGEYNAAPDNRFDLQKGPHSGDQKHLESTWVRLNNHDCLVTHASFESLECPRANGTYARGQTLSILTCPVAKYDPGSPLRRWLN